MKTILLTILLLPFIAQAQTDVSFKINHLLNASQNFSTTNKGQNNLGSNFTLGRMQYYISDISIKHDGGQTLSFVDTTILVDAYLNTNITFGNFNVTNLESVTFYLGVAQAKNHLDPSTYPSSHPLAPKSPSMHWGWTSGYRFFAIEGFSEGQVFELHGVGNALYEEIVVDFEETSAEDGSLVIDINAEYNEALRDLDLVAGFSLHGDENDAGVVTGKNNFKNSIFSANEGEAENPTNITNIQKEAIGLFPNPSKGQIFIDNSNVFKVDVYSLDGRFIQEKTLINKSLKINNNGIFFLYLKDDLDNIISINKVAVSK
ncbi:MAG: MbnP family protein [Chitinophagales bacterium]